MKGCKCCKNCEDRKINCHAWCEKYKGWQELHQKELEQIKESKLKESFGGTHRLNPLRTKGLQEKKRRMFR